MSDRPPPAAPGEPGTLRAKVWGPTEIVFEVLTGLVPPVLLGALLLLVVFPPLYFLEPPMEDLAGVGDPYYPDYGSGGYDAQAYEIDVSWDPEANTLSGTTVMRARADQPLGHLYLDLVLPATAVRVNGEPAAFGRRGFQDLRITPDEVISSGAEFVVEVDYAGNPFTVERQGLTPAYQTPGEFTIAGEPESSAWWFPSNDHPSDPALMDAKVRAPAGLEVLSVGRLASRDLADEEDFDTWHWTSDEPMATYLNFLSIGDFQIEQDATDRRNYVYAVTETLEPEDRDYAMKALQRSPEIIETLEGIYGPYPFTAAGGAVPAANFWFAGLETQTRPVYQAESLLSKDYTEKLLVHELAHQWFGDNVTMREWNDIFINEAYAAYAEWAYAEIERDEDPNEKLAQYHERYGSDAEFWQVTMTDPGRDTLFDTVYDRGPMALQALRNLIGDEAFNELSRSWAQEPGTRSTEDWMAAAQAVTDVDLTRYFDVWLKGTEAPEKTKENGFG
ncbi:MAG: M1 family metallopeptidase [Propionibacteriaceae bacterium]